LSPVETVRISLRALLRNKLRSFLTTLGVIIGVGAVVTMTTIGAGAKARIEETFSSMGSNMLVVRSGSSRQGGMRGGAGTQPTLTWEDLEAVSKEIPSVAYVAPVLGRAAQVMAEGQNWGTLVQGTTPAYFTIRSWGISTGSFFGQDDINGASKVAVIGKTVADNLFGPYTNPIGQIVRVNQVPFEIVGIAASKGQSGFGSDNDDVLFVPVTTFRSRLSGDLDKFLNGTIYVGAQSKEAMGSVQAEIESLLRRRHRIRPGEDDDFSVRNLAEAAAAQQEGAQIMTSLLAGIALVSLIVGGIGIMNIMLVSVTERTREIGLRMAVGAKPRHILLQFMVEAVSLSMLGGLIGVGLGVAGAAAIASRFAWPTVVDPGSALLALASSAIVGIGFGLYPAYQASRLDPIHALRYE
jgi:putative ABC transport system permease protein